MSGTVHFVAKNGFGFITPDDGSANVFFPYIVVLSDLVFEERLVGQRVEYEAIETARGPQAVFVRPAAIEQVQHD